MRALFGTLAIAALTAAANADDGAADGAAVAPIAARSDARPSALVTAAAPWRWQIFTAPAIAPQIGARAVSGLDAVAGRAPAARDVLGIAQPAPRRWPFGVDEAARPSIPAARPDERITAAFGTTTFELDDTAQGLEMLELRLRYEDGVAVWINGIEVVRQALPRGASTGLATRPHGPEWETFYVPVAPGLLRAGPNVLAAEVHPSGRRSAPKLVAELVGRRDRGIVRGPVLADVTATSAAVLVETDPGITATIEWGVGGKLDNRAQSARGRRHRFELSDLPAHSAVQYRVIAGASRSQRFTFNTHPAPGAPLRIGVYGDVRGGHAVHKKLVDHMLGEGLDLVATTGDLVLRGSDDGDWQRFFAVTSELLAQVPYLSAVGNHDLGWAGADHSQRDQQTFALPSGPRDRPPGTYWYSTDIADVHLVFLDSNNYDRLEQERWLDADLAAARARKARSILVFTHDGPYARGYHGGSAIARDRYVPILTKHRVDLVFSGHDHIYQRGEHAGLRYVVAGGGGASLYGIRCGVPGRPRCRVEDGMQKVAREHHYITLAIGRDIELCTRRVDGTLLEPCVQYPLLQRK